MTEVEKAWLACAIDGEGFISMSDRIDPKTGWQQRFIEIGVVNTDKRFVDEAARLIEGHIRLRKRRGVLGNTSYVGKKDVYDVRLKDHVKVAAILIAIRPYLIIKGDKADRAIEFEARTKWREMSPAARQRKSEQTRRTWEEGKRSRVRSEEAKAKQSASLKAYYAANPISDAERKRRSERLREQWANGTRSKTFPRGAAWDVGKRSRVRSEEAKAKQRAYYVANPVTVDERKRRSERVREQWANGTRSRKNAPR